MDRLTTETWVGGGNAMTHAYDAVGNLLDVQDATSHLTMTYDALNRITTVDNSGTSNVPAVKLTYTYDAVGNRLSLADSIANLAGLANQYVYDALNRLTSVTQSGPALSAKRVDFVYNGLTVEHAVTKILPRLANKALESSGASEMSVLGYCMGAPLSACFLTTHPEFPLKNYIDMAGPIDFAHVGMFGQWLDARYFDVDKYVDTLGSHPGRHGEAGLQAAQADDGPEHEREPLVEPVEPGLRRRASTRSTSGRTSTCHSPASSSASG